MVGPQMECFSLQPYIPIKWFGDATSIYFQNHIYYTLATWEVPYCTYKLSQYGCMTIQLFNTNLLTSDLHVDWPWPLLPGIWQLLRQRTARLSDDHTLANSSGHLQRSVPRASWKKWWTTNVYGKNKIKISRAEELWPEFFSIVFATHDENTNPNPSVFRDISGEKHEEKKHLLFIELVIYKLPNQNWIPSHFSPCRRWRFSIEEHISLKSIHFCNICQAPQAPWQALRCKGFTEIETYAMVMIHWKPNLDLWSDFDEYGK